jgi:hypothetical protein
MNGRKTRKPPKKERIMKEKKVIFRVFFLFAMVSMVATLLLGVLAGAQEYPIMDMMADKVIQKYQQSTCEQLWEKKGEPKSPREQEAIQLLRNDPQMRKAFIDKVAAPIANKMFECGMIP